ncbi:hypothetical protein BH09ACT10_BH09ACT10_25270 [soil metagenome]
MPLRSRALLICLALVGSLTLQLPAAHAAGSPRWTEISASSSAMFGGRLYFFADDGIHGKELWRTNGTLGGTELVVDSNPGNSVSDTKLDKTLKATAPRVGSPSKTSKSYRWYADGVAIAKATKKTYVLTSAERGKRITLRVTVKKKACFTVVSTSKATATVKAP